MFDALCTQDVREAPLMTVAYRPVPPGPQRTRTPQAGIPVDVVGGVRQVRVRT
jgi:hypothetical protein